MQPPAYEPEKQDSEKSQGKNGVAKQSDLDALQAIVTSLEMSNMEIMTSISGLHEDKTQNMMDIEAANSAQMSLVDDLTPVMESIVPLMTDIDSLMMSDNPFGVASALIADYFTVNDTQIDLENLQTLNLVDPFCVAELSVLKFELAATFNEALDPRVNIARVRLLINDVPVANAEFIDREAPSSLSLRYQGRVDADSEVMV